MNKPLHPKIYSKSQIRRIGDAGKIVKEVLNVMGEMCVEGITTKELDDIAFKTITKLKGKPACLGYKGFPASSCISIDSVILHGIPNETIIKNGMLVGIDCPVLYSGMYADAAINVEVGEVDEMSKKLNGKLVHRYNMSFFKENDKNKTLLLYNGGGIGDGFMYIRFVPTIFQRFPNNILY